MSQQPAQPGDVSGNVEAIPIRANNWFAVSRALFEHPVVGAAKPVCPADPNRGAHSYFEAWLDIVSLARHSPARINNKGTVMLLQRAQLMAGRAFLSRRWNWSEKTVRTFLDRLEREDMIRRDTQRSQGQHKVNQNAIITVLNYDRFQCSAKVQGPAKWPATGQHGAGGRPESNTSTIQPKNLPLSPVTGTDSGISRSGRSEVRSGPNGFPRPRRARGAHAVIDTLVVEYGHEVDRARLLRPLLTMAPKLDDAVAWSEVLLKMTGNFPGDFLQWAADDIVRTEVWRPSHAAILTGMEKRAAHERILQELSDELASFHAGWSVAKNEDAHLIASVGKPKPDWDGTGVAPVITDDDCFFHWLGCTGGLHRWKELRDYLSPHNQNRFGGSGRRNEKNRADSARGGFCRKGTDGSWTSKPYASLFNPLFRFPARRAAF